MKKKNLKKLDFEKSYNFLDGLEKIKNVIEKVEKDESTEESNLLVKTPFRHYSKGTLITKKEEIEKILNSHEKSMVFIINKK